jgi:O-antigen ligase
MVLAVILWIIQHEDRRRILFYTLATMGFALIVTSIIPAPIAPFGPAQAFGTADLNAAGVTDVSSGRLDLWRGTIEHIMQRPWFGWGVNQFSGFKPIPNEIFFHPHNFPLQLLHACGVIGTLAVVVAVVPMIGRHPALLANRYGRFHAALLCALGAYSLYDGIFYFAYPLLVCMLAMVPFLQPPALPHD